MPSDETRLVRHYQQVYSERMQGLPIVNERLRVEAVGFDAFDGHRLGVLITPWFMNLVLLPATDQWKELQQGDIVDVDLPAERHQLMICRDEDLGVHLTAILFRTVADFPDQQTARDVAVEIMTRLMQIPSSDSPPPARSAERVSRRDLFTRLGAR